MLRTKAELEAALAACNTHKGLYWVDSKKNLGPLGAGLAVREPKITKLIKKRNEVLQPVPDNLDPESYCHYKIDLDDFEALFGQDPNDATDVWARLCGYPSSVAYENALVVDRDQIKERIREMIRNVRD